MSKKFQKFDSCYLRMQCQFTYQAERHKLHTFIRKYIHNINKRKNMTIMFKGILIFINMNYFLL